MPAPPRRAASASGSASSAATARGVPGTMTRPMKPAPQAVARSTSRSRRTPQTLTRPKASARAAWAGRCARISAVPIEHRVGQRRQPIDIGAALDARFRNEQAIARNQRRKPLGHGEIDLERAQVAIVDAEDRRAEGERPPHLAFVMRLDQSVHAEPPGHRQDLGRLGIVEQRQDDENGVGAVEPGFGNLARVDDEVLGEDRAVEDPPHRAQILERAAEIGAVGEDADRVRGAGIGAPPGRRARPPPRSRRRKATASSPP